MLGLPIDEFDSQTQALREQFLSSTSFAQQIDTSDESVTAFWRAIEFGNSTRNITRRCLLNECIVSHDEDLRVTAEDNLCAAALDEFSLEQSDRTAIAHNVMRDISLLITETAVVIIGNSSLPSGVRYGAPLLQAIGMVSGLGAYVIRRDLERNPCFLRMLALRGGSIGFLVSCFRLYLFSGLRSSSVLADISRRNCIVISSSCLLFETIFRCCSPLRDRLQRRWTVVNDNSLVSNQNRNSEAVRVGTVNRIVRSLMQVGTGSAVLFGMGSLLGAVVFPILSTGNPMGNGSRRLMILISVTGCLSLTSLIANIRQTRRLFGRLYNYDHSLADIIEPREGGIDMSPEDDEVFFDDSSEDS